MANENKASRASIGGKLAMGFGTVVLIALILGLIGVVGINRLSDTMGYVAGDRFSDLRSLAGLNYQRMVITADTLDALRAEGRPNRDEALRRILARRRDAREHRRTLERAALVSQAIRGGKATPRDT